MRKLTLILVILLCVASILTAQEVKKKPTIVVIPFETRDVDANDAEALFDTFTNKIVDSGKFKVVDRSKVNEIKKQHEFQNSDWSNDEKVAKLGNALNASLVVVGKIQPFQKQMKAYFRILDINTMEIVSTAEGLFSDILDLFNKTPEVVKKLTGEIKSISMSSNITTSKTESSSVSTNVSASSTNGKTYNIGDDGPGGGIIFYYSEAGFDVYEIDGSTKKCHYLEVSKFDLGKISWCSQKGLANCCNITTTLTKLGSGKINTFKIIKSSHKSGTITKENCAALACHSYSTATTKAGDWFLPSRDELNLLYKNLGERVLLSNTTNGNRYWSSSQRDKTDHAWYQSFSDGYQFGNLKLKLVSVRAVRAF